MVLSYIEKLFDSRSCSLDYQHISEGHTGQNGKLLQTSLSPPLINWSWGLKNTKMHFFLQTFRYFFHWQYYYTSMFGSST